MNDGHRMQRVGGVCFVVVSFRHAREVMSEMAEQDNYHLEMVSPRGSQECLPTEVEELLKNFVADAYDIGVPRSRSQLVVDIQEYVRQEKIQVSFMNDKPGNDFDY